MIAVRLVGGLGNQLFQYAYGREISHRLGVPLLLDTRWYSYVSPQADRRYDLARYRISASVAASSDLPAVAMTRLERWLTRLRRNRGPVQRVYEYLGPGFKPAAHNVSDGTLLIGYWQSEKFFPTVRQNLRDELTTIDPPAGEATHYIDKIRDCEAVSIHVRRGDYLLADNTSFGILQTDYYSRAVEAICARVAKPHFFVFSEDLDWCRRNLGLPDATYVVGNTGSMAYEDLRLMSLCRHNIIANSSFSWLSLIHI